MNNVLTGTSSQESLDDLPLRQATADDLHEVSLIIGECADWLSRQGMTHWTEYYTSRQIEHHLKLAEVWLLELNEEPAATITFDTRCPPYYLAMFNEEKVEA